MSNDTNNSSDDKYVDDLMNTLDEIDCSGHEIFFKLNEERDRLDDLLFYMARVHNPQAEPLTEEEDDRRKQCEQDYPAILATYCNLDCESCELDTEQRLIGGIAAIDTIMSSLLGLSRTDDCDCGGECDV